MNQIGIIVPTYPPHYNFLDFLNKLPDGKLDFDLFLVLSFKSDLDELLKYNYKLIYKVIILEDYFDKILVQMIIDKSVIITFKKYFALNILKTQYKYCATIDCEIEFVNINNIFEKFQTYCNNKKIIGSCINTNDFRHKLIKDINESSAIYFKETEYYNKLMNVTDNFSMYFWFSDIPIYNMLYINEFFEFINFTDYYKFIEKTSRYCFDYIVYAYFIVLFKDYSFINIKDYGLTRNWSLESMPIETYNQVIEKIKYRPLWLIYNTYNENKDNINNNDIIITYHRNDGRYIYINDDYTDSV